MSPDKSADPEDKIPNPSAIQYFEALEKTARAQGINIPLQANDPNPNTFSWSKDFSSGNGNVDLYGLDSYPACWTCNLTECNSVNGAYQPFKVMDYYSHFQEVSPTQPNFLPEFQGGSFNPWGGPKGGCPENSPPDFANLFYRNNIGQRVTAMSLYMLYGGTNWGYLAAPVVATSYDYSAPISENRMIWDKYSETKLLGLFIRAAKDLTMTNRIATNQTKTTNPAVVFSELRNPKTNAGFYVTIHQNSSIGTKEAFKVAVNTSIGELTIPQYGSSVVLNGHQSKILVTDFNFGSHSLLYSTAEVLSTSVIDGRDILALWVPTGETGEFIVKGASSGKVVQGRGTSSVKFHKRDKSTAVSITQRKGMSVLTFDNDLTVLVLDRSAAYRFYAPVMSDDPFAPSNETLFVQGPDLVRRADYLRDSSILSLTGDNNGTRTDLKVFAQESTKVVFWNGKQVKMAMTGGGCLSGTIAGPSIDSIKLPSVTGWKANDSLQERMPSYDDSRWVHANHTSTPNPYPPQTLPVLYIDEYGYHVGNHLWRGRFEGSASGVFLNVTGGRAFGWSAYLNGDFIGSYLGTAYDSMGEMRLSFTNATVNRKGENVLLVLQDNHGHDETTQATIPRGISNATLIGNKFTSWKVQGTAGGEANIDPVRGVYSEGGLYGERAGWHLPGFDDKTWNTSQPSTSISAPGVTFYRTNVALDIPDGLDAAISFVLSAKPANAPVRALLFVNGYQYAQFNPHIGHQTDFPVPPGILNYAGSNTIALSVWRQTPDAGAVSVDWKITGVFASSFSPKIDTEYLQPGWTEKRLQYL